MGHSVYISVVTLLYSSLRVLYNQNKHKDTTIKNLVTFFK